MIIQCMSKMKAIAATHADHRRTDGDPRSTTQGEHNTKNRVVAALTVESTAWCTVRNWTSPLGQIAQAARRVAFQPGNGGRKSCALSVGRNHAAAWRIQAAKMKR